jgi:NAD(P)-dependent dehydrogenase (short-subunit alcohol dehydrogenase family)
MKKISVIVGGTGGIGSAIARRLVKNGEAVHLVARNEDRLSDLATELRCTYSVCDASDEAALRSTLDSVAQESEISGIAVCVGSILLKPGHMTTLDEFRRCWELNVVPAFLAIKLGIPHLRAKGGSILLFSSAAAKIGLPNHEAIASAKGAVIGLVQSAAATYAANNIRVNCIAPGLVRTPLSEKITSNPMAENASLAFHPLNRLGEPNDISGIAAWLLSDESSWTTGQTFTVDGGLSGLKVPKLSA